MNATPPAAGDNELAALYRRVDDALRAAGCDLDAAECHGVLTGMLCGSLPFASATWLAHVSAEEGGGRLATGETRALLERLVELTRAGLEDSGFSFDLLLPAARQGLAARARAFAAWCHGFLAGCALGGIVELGRLGEDARGFLRDVERFCRLEVAADDDEDDERALDELTEFTRVGAVLLHAELAGEAPAARPAPRLH